MTHEFIRIQEMLRNASVEAFNNYVDKLEYDNKMLRILVSDMYDELYYGGEYTEPYELRMRELGIEVE